MKVPRGSYDAETLSSRLKPAWVPRQNADGTSAKPVIRCACGDLIGMGLHHVHADGRVTASFHHWWPPETLGPTRAQGCGFHEFLELDGYADGEFPPEPR